MASAKGNTPKPMPFPGESPTVSLAMAAGRMYAPAAGESEKPARAKAKRRAAGSKRAKAGSAGKPAKRAQRKSTRG